MPAGYSGTSLGKKLGVKTGQTTWRKAMPASVESEIAGYGETPLIVDTPAVGLAMAHIFETRRAELAVELARLRTLIAPDGMVWVSWPKQAAKLDTDITEDVIRAIALPMGFVDIKVCAVDATWSGLKLVIRKTERP